MPALANLLLLGIGGLALYTIGKRPEGAVGPGPVYPPAGAPPGAPPAPARAVWPPPGAPPIPTGVTFGTPPDVSVWSLPTFAPAPVPPGTLVWVESERMMYEATGEGVTIGPGDPSDPSALTGRLYRGWRPRPDLVTTTETVGLVIPTETGALSQYQALAPARARARALGLRR